MVAIATLEETRPIARSASDYMPALDGLRALAILLVIPHNASVLVSHDSPLTHLIGLVTNVGWIGVQLFFALSGFLITGNLLDSRSAPNYYRAFFGRRVLRIFPLYYLTIVVVCGIAPLIWSMPDTFRASLQYLPWLLLFVSNWVGPFEMTVEGFPHFWSLAIEEQFYLLWPFIVRRCEPRRLLSVCLMVMVAALLIRVAMIYAGSPSDPLYMFTTSRMDALAAGAALACMLRMPVLADWLTQRANAMMVCTGVLLLIGALTTSGYTNEAATTHSYGYSILAAGFALIVAIAAIRPAGKFNVLWQGLTLAPVRAIGRYSYAMYVFHLPLHMFIGTKVLRHFVPHMTNAIALLYMLGLLIATFALAALSYRYIESRFLAMKKYFVPNVRPT